MKFTALIACFILSVQAAEMMAEGTMTMNEGAVMEKPMLQGAMAMEKPMMEGAMAMEKPMMGTTEEGGTKEGAMMGAMTEKGMMEGATVAKEGAMATKGTMPMASGMMMTSMWVNDIMMAIEEQKAALSMANKVDVMGFISSFAQMNNIPEKMVWQVASMIAMVMQNNNMGAGQEFMAFEAVAMAAPADMMMGMNMGMMSGEKGMMQDNKGIMAENKGMMEENKGMMAEGTIAVGNGMMTESKGMTTERTGMMENKGDMLPMSTGIMMEGANKIGVKSSAVALIASSFTTIALFLF
ncbi:hypothetical protein BC830DRAFT_265019 [Chytriomyces sp. MP71]|nr:hypothetical protein BC830DRAFT_265019 [Chytriomyces sp. MP71]